MPSTMPLQPHAITPAMLARHGVATLLVCVLITVALTLAKMGSWDVNLVYSLAIGLLSWLSIEFARFALSRGRNMPWPAGWQGPAIVVVGAAIGLCIGSWIGQRYQRLVQPDAAVDWTALGALPVIITLLVSAGMSFTYYLIGQSRHLRMQAAEAQLALLQSQLEPHMLFNTLANLRVLIDTDPARAQVMLDHLIAYLRATLGHSRSTEHSLKEEFARLQDYLALMQVRMGSRLVYTLDLPDTLADVRVPPLLLQPLVENSIRHGLEPQLAGGAIRVTARGLGDRQVELCVLDTGAGLDMSADASPQPFGTTQVRERLATRYGQSAEFNLTAAPDGQGTLARITFPKDSH